MKGAEYPPKVQDYIKLNLLMAPNDNCELTNLAATKSGFTVSENHKDFEYKKENLLELIEKNK